MKLAPIVNPHALTNTISKKTKAQEREERLMETKRMVLDKADKEKQEKKKRGAVT